MCVSETSQFTSAYQSHETLLERYDSCSLLACRAKKSLALSSHPSCLRQPTPFFSVSRPCKYENLLFLVSIGQQIRQWLQITDGSHFFICIAIADLCISHQCF